MAFPPIAGVMIPVIDPITGRFLLGECPTCMEEGRQLLSDTGSLDHAVCEPCLTRWVEKNPSCPLCRARITSINGKELEPEGCKMGLAQTVSAVAGLAFSAYFGWVGAEIIHDRDYDVLTDLGFILGSGAAAAISLTAKRVLAGTPLQESSKAFFSGSCVSAIYGLIPPLQFADI